MKQYIIGLTDGSSRVVYGTVNVLDTRRRQDGWKYLHPTQLLQLGLHRFSGIKGDGRNHNDYAFRVKPLEYFNSDNVYLPIDPYLLGVWLGDGDSHTSSFTVGDQDRDEMVSLVEFAGARIVSIRRDRTGWRVRFSLDDSRKKKSSFTVFGEEYKLLRNKHVPRIFLMAGTHQRLALLQGLMDTDGYMSKRSAQAEFCSTNRNLAESVLFLSRSIGFRATLREGLSKLNGTVHGPKYRVTFSPIPDLCPFRLQRKRLLVKPPVGDRSAVSIKSVEERENA